MEICGAFRFRAADRFRRLRMNTSEEAPQFALILPRTTQPRLICVLERTSHSLQNPDL